MSLNRLNELHPPTTYKTGEQAASAIDRWETQTKCIFDEYSAFEHEMSKIDSNTTNIETLIRRISTAAYNKEDDGCIITLFLNETNLLIFGVQSATRELERLALVRYPQTSADNIRYNAR